MTIFGILFFVYLLTATMLSLFLPFFVTGDETSSGELIRILVFWPITLLIWIIKSIRILCVQLFDAIMGKN